MKPAIRWLLKVLAPVVKIAIYELAPVITEALLEHRRAKQAKVLSLVKAMSTTPKDAA